MTAQQTMQTRLMALAKEHRNVNKRIADLKKFWLEVSELGEGPKFEELKAHVGAFGELLSAHMAREEHLFHDMRHLLDSNTGERVSQLTLEHAEFLQRLLENVDRLDRDKEYCNNADWQAIGDEIEDLIERLADHEAAETALIHQFLESEDFISGVA